MPERKKNFTVTEIKAGAMVLVSVAVLILFVIVVRGYRPPEEVKILYAGFTDTGGLNRGADVRYGGTKVGRVAAIELDPEDQSKVRVEARIEPEVPVNAESQAFIGQTTLTAEKHLEITTGTKGAALLESGASILSKSGSIFDQAGQLARSVETALEDVRDLLGVRDAKDSNTDGKVVTLAKLFEGVDKTLGNGSELVGDLRQTVLDSRDDIEAVLAKVQDIEAGAKSLLDEATTIVDENRGNIRGATAGVRKMIDDAQPAVEQVVKLAERLDAMADALQQTLETTGAAATEASGTIADNRPLIEDIVLDLRETVRYLKTFTRTLAQQPEAVIRGKSLEGRQ